MDEAAAAPLCVARARAATTTIVLFALVLTFVGAAGCVDLLPAPPHAPKAKGGAIDLSSWDFDEHGALALEGEWELVWHALPTDADVVSAAGGIVEGGRNWPDDRYDDTGYAVYRLKVKLPSSSSSSPLTLARTHADSAYNLYVDDGAGHRDPVIAGGVLGTDEASERPYARYAIGELPRDGDGDVVILNGVSNFHYPRGGDGNATIIGTREQIDARRGAQRSRDFFLVGFIFVVGVYHLVLFALRREELAPLWFGLFCLVMAQRALERGRHLEDLLPTLELWAATKRCEYLGFYLAVPLFVLYLDALLDHAMQRHLRRAFVAVYFLLAAIVVVTPPNVFGLTADFAQLVALPCLAWMLVEIARSLRRERDRSLWFVLGGFTVIAATVVLDILSNRAVVPLPSMTSFGQAVFVVAQAVVIAVSNARARKRAEDLTQELMRLSKLKDEFLANTSHELRTPLHGVIGLGQALLDGVKGPLSSEQAEDLSLIVQSAQRLSSLINDILDFEKIKNRELTLRIAAVDVHSIADIVAAFSRPLARAGVDVQNDVPDTLPLVAADEARLQQVLFNLVGNAVKFTHDGSVKIGAAVDDKARVVRVLVADTGIGIPEARQADVFKAFEQVDGSTAREYGGTGLGLGITKKLVELHNGDIGVTSKVGAGSTFWFTVPISDKQDGSDANGDAGALIPPRTVPVLASSKPTVALAAARSLTSSSAASTASAASTSTSAPHSGPNEAGSASARSAGSAAAAGSAASAGPAGATGAAAAREKTEILIVDDEPVNLRVLESYLAQTGYVVRKAASGPEALALVDDGCQPDLVLLDVMMPRMSGYSVCAKLRQRWASHLMPILLVTAKGQTGDIVDGFAAGANDYLLKPVSRAELLARIQTHLQLAKMSTAAGRFVPFEFLDILDKRSLVDVKRGDHTQKDLSILFSDIRSFTTILEAMTPSSSFAFINEYLERMEVPIRAHAGFIDSYIGDAIMALFDGPTDDAVQAGIGKLDALKEYNVEREKRGAPGLRIGIGINTGPLMLGTIGGAHRINCGVIGDAVNLAARIEGMTKMYGASLLVSEHTFDAVRDKSKYHSRVVDRVRVKGKSKPVTVHEILDGAPASLHDQKRSTLGRWREGIDRYAAADIGAALAIFRECAKKAPDDEAAALYVARCDGLAAGGVPAGWDGVVDLATK